MGHFDREVVRVKAKLVEGGKYTSTRKFALDPEIASFDMLRVILAQAFALTDDFSISYLVEGCAGGSESIWLSLHSDWDLDAAFISCSPPAGAQGPHDANLSNSSSEPIHCLRLRVYPRAPGPHDECLSEWDVITPMDLSIDPFSVGNSARSPRFRSSANANNTITSPSFGSSSSSLASIASTGGCSGSSMQRPSFPPSATRHTCPAHAATADGSSLLSSLSDFAPLIGLGLISGGSTRVDSAASTRPAAFSSASHQQPSQHQQSETQESRFSRFLRSFALPKRDSDTSLHRSRLLKNPMTEAERRVFFDANGLLIKPKDFRLSVYLGGIDGALRPKLWPLLLGVYRESSTQAERERETRARCAEYERMKRQWRDVYTHVAATDAAFVRHTNKQHQQRPSAEQLEAAYAAETVDEILRITSFIRKDVVRTDRSHPYFQAEDSEHLAQLFDILVTYSLAHPSVSYVQGMSDLASPLLVVLRDEALAYVCFCALMARLKPNFMYDGVAMEKKLAHLQRVINALDPELMDVLRELELGDLLFTYRWLLLECKREFQYDEALLVFEVLWSTLPPECLPQAIANASANSNGTNKQSTQQLLYESLSVFDLNAAPSPNNASSTRNNTTPKSCNNSTSLMPVRSKPRAVLSSVTPYAQLQARHLQMKRASVSSRCAASAGDPIWQPSSLERTPTLGSQTNTPTAAGACELVGASAASVAASSKGSKRRLDRRGLSACTSTEWDSLQPFSSSNNFDADTEDQSAEEASGCFDGASASDLRASNTRPKPQSQTGATQPSGNSNSVSVLSRPEAPADPWDLDVLSSPQRHRPELHEARAHANVASQSQKPSRPNDLIQWNDENDHSLMAQNHDATASHAHDFAEYNDLLTENGLSSGFSSSGELRAAASACGSTRAPRIAPCLESPTPPSEHEADTNVDSLLTSESAACRSSQQQPLLPQQQQHSRNDSSATITSSPRAEAANSLQADARNSNTATKTQPDAPPPGACSSAQCVDCALAALPPAEELGGGNPFLIFLVASIVLSVREASFWQSTARALEADDVILYFERSVRRHSAPRLLLRTQNLYSLYLRVQQQRALESWATSPDVDPDDLLSSLAIDRAS